MIPLRVVGKTTKKRSGFTERDVRNERFVPLPSTNGSRATKAKKEIKIGKLRSSRLMQRNPSKKAQKFFWAEKQRCLRDELDDNHPGRKIFFTTSDKETSMTTAPSSSAEVGSVSRLLQRDDQIAIVEILTRYKGFIAKLAYAALDPRFERFESGDDRLQEALLKVWDQATKGRFKDIPDRRHLISWLRAVVLNNGRDLNDKAHANKRRMLGESSFASLNGNESSLAGISGVPDDEHAPDIQAMEREQMRLEREQMRLVEEQLDEDERHLLQLQMEGLSQKEIAKELGGVVPATVRNRRNRMLAKLRRLCEEQTDE